MDWSRVYIPVLRRRRLKAHRAQSLKRLDMDDDYDFFLRDKKVGETVATQESCLC